jgi:threonine dehydrogenase-like Zn-dependent dehydrogenase
MKALVYTNTQEMQFRDEPKPYAAADEVLLRVASTAICGSDMHAYHGLDERRVPPLILGHEVAGYVEGGELDGQLAVVNPLMSCGHCGHCLGGRANLCAERELIGMYLAGAYAEYVVIKRSNLLFPDRPIEPWVASLTEPTATALHAVVQIERCSYRPVSELRVLVIGGGAIGLLAALILHAKGCHKVALAETNALRRGTVFAQKISGVPVAQVFDPLSEAVPNSTEYDVVIDCVGSGATRRMASAQVMAGGILSHVGLQDSNEGLDTRRLTLQEVTFLGNYCYTHADMKASLDMLAQGRLGDLAWVETRALSEGAEAFADLHNGKVAAAKIVLEPTVECG